MDSSIAPFVFIECYQELNTLKTGDFVLACEYTFKIKRSQSLVFTPAAVFDGKRIGKNRVSYTQFSLVDIDKLEEGQAERLMQRLKDDPYWLLAYITLSGKGLRIIFRVEGVTEVWEGIENALAEQGLPF